MGERFTPQGAEVELSAVRFGRDEALNPLFFRGEDFRGAGQGGCGVETLGFGQGGQHIVAQAIAGEGPRSIGFVLAPGELARAGIGGDFVPGESKQGTHDGRLAFFQRRLAPQAAQPSASGTPGEVEEQGFRGVAGMVREENGGGVVLGRRPGEESPPQLPRGFFERFFVLRGAGAGLTATADKPGAG